MLDRVEAGADTGVDRVLAVGVGGDLAAKAVRGLGDSLKLGVGELAVGRGVGLIEGAAAGHDLDDIGTALDRGPDGASAVVGARRRCRASASPP